MFKMFTAIKRYNKQFLINQNFMKNNLSRYFQKHIFLNNSIIQSGVKDIIRVS